jgi:hypothetical protein
VEQTSGGVKSFLFEKAARDNYSYQGKWEACERMAIAKNQNANSDSAKNKNSKRAKKQSTTLQKWKLMTFANKIMSIATVVIACATCLYTYISLKTLSEIESGSIDTHKLAEATLAASRAWVVPEQIVLSRALESGPPLKYQIRLVNPGKEPAIGVVSYVRPFGGPYIADGSSTANEMEENETCSGLEPIASRGFVLYPSGSGNFWMPLDLPDNPENRALIESVQKREKSLFIDGCFAYITATQKHTSAFRFILRDVPGPSFTTDKQGNEVPAWNFNMALSGNQVN